MKMRVKFVPVGTVCNFPALHSRLTLDSGLWRETPPPALVPDLISSEVQRGVGPTERNFCLKDVCDVCPPPVGTILG